MTGLSDAGYWDLVAQGMRGGIFEENVASYYRNEHIKLAGEWGGDLRGKNILKTDLFEEAFENGDFLYHLSDKGAKVFGMDISCAIVKKSASSARSLASGSKNLIVSDIRRCAFKDGVFDLIISNSTVDNIAPAGVSMALSELRRILKPSGVIILTLDNRHNPLYLTGYVIERFLRTNKYYQARCYSIREAESLARKNKLIVKEISAIVHIPTPFNKIALLLGKFGNNYIKKTIKRSVNLFSRLGDKKTRFFTGWFLALKLVKNE